MKIKKYSNITTTFDKIEIGEVFEYNAYYFLKTPIIVTLGDIDYDSVCIRSGAPFWFSDNTEVIKVDATLLIDN